MTASRYQRVVLKLRERRLSRAGYGIAHSMLTSVASNRQRSPTTRRRNAYCCE